MGRISRTSLLTGFTLDPLASLLWRGLAYGPQMTFSHAPHGISDTVGPFGFWKLAFLTLGSSLGVRYLLVSLLFKFTCIV